MASLTSIEFVDATFYCDRPLALSYNPNLKWHIRRSLLSLFGNFPSLKPSMDTFTYDDGTTFNLLNLKGSLTISPATLPVPLTIWILQNYPVDPPLVFLSSTPSTQMLHNHPFIDPSGSISFPYLHTWLYPRSNLVDLVRSLVHIFTYCHPFTPSTSSRFIDPSLTSKMEALNFLFMALHHDLVCLSTKTKDDIEALPNLQAELKKRAALLKDALQEIEHEMSSLKQKVRNLTNEVDILINWLRLQGPNSSINRGTDKMEDAFDIEDGESKQVLDYLGEDHAIEDLIYALDKAVKEEVIPVEKYLKQVRTLAREQFFCRAKLVKLKGPDILHPLDYVYGSFTKCTYVVLLFFLSYQILRYMAGMSFVLFCFVLE